MNIIQFEIALQSEISRLEQYKERQQSKWFVNSRIVNHISGQIYAYKQTLEAIKELEP